ncbi:MAG: MATE family efflux transporter [Clostridiales bacterium]|nr:MATE family efflux transporter [Clostridiales bacterium]
MVKNGVPVRDRMLRDREFINKLLTLALPIALQNLMLAAVAASDALMLGRLEQNAMAAVSLATQIQFVQNMALSSAVSAFIILAAQYWGKGDTHSISDLFFMALRFCTVLSALFFVGCVFFPRYLMLLFTDAEVLIEIGCEYLRIAGWSYLLTGFSQCYLALMKVSEHARSAAYISSGAVVLNIVLNAIFIYGLLGVPAMGVQGAATATLIARIIELVISVALSFHSRYLRPEAKRFFMYKKLLAGDFRRVMLPLLGACLFWGVGFTSYTAFVGHLGTDAAAANSVAAVVRDLICCLCNGLGYGGGILIGNELGSGDLEKGKLYGERLMKLGFICGFASMLIVLALTPVILSFVKLTEGAQSLLWGMMVIMAIYMIGRSVNTVIINGIFSAGGDTLFDVYSLAVCMWGIAIPLAALGTFVFNWPVLLVYACTCLDEVGKIPWVMAHYKRYKWVKDLTREQTE